MHRSPLGVLTAALALLSAALVVPHGSAPTTKPHAAALISSGSTSPSSVAPVAPLLPVTYAHPVRECRAGLIALTFDDGPSASVTMGLVRTLQRLDVPATFFMVGSRVHANPEVARKVQRAGFRIANHSWAHRQLTALPQRAVLRELARTRQEFLSQRVVAGSLMRPPYGATNRRVGREVRSLGLTPVLWSVDSFDWSGGNAVQIAHRLLTGVRPHRTNIVLQHDGVTNSPNSVRAVPIIVKKARQRGYCFAGLDASGRVAVPVPQLRTTVVPGTEDGPAPVRIKLELDRPTTRAVSVRVQTVSGSARSGEDFTPQSARLTFPRGVRTLWITVPVVADDDAEGLEDLRVVLDQPHGLVVGRREVAATIFDR